MAKVSVTSSGGRTAARATETVNVRSRLATALSAEVIVTDCCAAVAAVMLEVSPASIVKAVSPVPSERPAPAGTESMIDTGTLTTGETDAVTALLSPFSGIVRVPSVRVTLGASAASMIVADPEMLPNEMQQLKLTGSLKSTAVGYPGDARLAFAVQSIVRVLVVTERPDCPHSLHVKLSRNAENWYAAQMKMFLSNAIFNLKSCPSIILAGSVENVTLCCASSAGTATSDATNAAAGSHWIYVVSPVGRLVEPGVRSG